MDHIPGEVYRKGRRPYNPSAFLKASKTPVTEDMNATRVEAEVYLARTLNTASNSIGLALKELTDTTRIAMNDHAAALTAASKASDTYGKKLTFATWSLVAVTAVLVILAFIQLNKG